jgi:hypothetical protein
MAPAPRCEIPLVLCLRAMRSSTPIMRKHYPYETAVSTGAMTDRRPACVQVILTMRRSGVVSKSQWPQCLPRPMQCW